MTQLILHIGTHKTGTTSIQKVLADNRAWLRAKGLVYPDGGQIYKGEHPHHDWSHSLTGVERRRPETTSAFIDYAASLGHDSDMLLISAEPIYRHMDGIDAIDVVERPDYWARRERYVKNLAAALGRFDVRVVVWFREKDSFARSLYAEVTAKGYWNGSFDRFRDVYQHWFQYDRQVNLFRQAFANVDVFSYEDDCRNGLIASFFSRIEMPPRPDQTKYGNVAVPKSTLKSLRQVP